MFNNESKLPSPKLRHILRLLPSDHYEWMRRAQMSHFEWETENCCNDTPIRQSHAKFRGFLTTREKRLDFRRRHSISAKWNGTTATSLHQARDHVLTDDWTSNFDGQISRDPLFPFFALFLKTFQIVEFQIGFTRTFYLKKVFIKNRQFWSENLDATFTMIF